MQLRTTPLPFDPASISGLSERLLESHHANNYGGAVKRLNAIRADLAALPFASAPGYTINGLKREELIATNSVLLHELYFACLGGDVNAEPPPAMALALAASFGSVECWREEFVAMGRALGGGSGWVLLVFQPHDGTLVNQWAADHTQAVAGGVPIAALDMYEHAYHLDFGAAAGRYVDAFMAQLNWPAIHRRYQRAVTAATGDIGASPQDAQQAAHIIDVRRAGAYAAAVHVLPGARWEDPTRVDAWADTLPANQTTVVYCVHGHEVSRAVALRLHASGRPVRFLEGGIEAWAAAGMPLASRP
ncbi:Fe-Mn family superoxide dismutase [Acidovorax sp. BL-A-41-H1]|uniref:Fe-Mn family superoxide dismutase n=1 Tax=Acidovorax sp. BL-A-41-H1 TaxID=3421102 RepID=UPI003F7AADEA